jgi:methionyl-tRNA formyltransferase
MRTVFFGTPEFAVPALRSLVAYGADVVGVVTQPDRPVGRSGRGQPPPVKEAAERLGLRVLQSATLRTPEAVAELQLLAPDVIVVVAFGQILRRAVLALPPLGCLNVHGSLLPRLRGASPIQTAIRDGLAETGVTIMLMNERMDAGPVLAQAGVTIAVDDTSETLAERLANVGAALLVDTLPRWQSGLIQPKPQDEALATYCRPLTKADANVDWSGSASQVERTCRAYTPWPGCQSFWNGQQVRFLSVGAEPNWRGTEPPGTVIRWEQQAKPNGAFAVACGQGALLVYELQLAGRRPLPAPEFVRGHPQIIGARLASPSPPLAS